MTVKKKICYVITRLVAGGAQKIVLDLIEALKEDEVELYLVAGPEIGKEGSFWPWAERLLQKEHLFRCPYLVRSVSPLKDYYAYKWLKKLFKKHRFDIVHTHTSKAGVVGRFAANSAKIPYIIHSTHGLIYNVDANIPGVKGNLAIKVFKTVEQKVGTFTDCLLTLSENETGDALKLNLISSGKVQAVSNGINLKPFLEIEREPSSWQVPHIRIGIAGRLNAEKGHEILIKSIRDVLEHYPNVSLKIAGDGPLKNDLIALSKELDIEEHILFCGFYDNISEFMEEIDIFVLSSHYEGFGLVLVEAMASGLPIVATDVGGVREVVCDGKNSIIVPSGSEGELALGIEYFLQNPKCAYEYGQHGRQHAQTNYSIEHMVEAHRKVYARKSESEEAFAQPKGTVKIDLHMHSLKSFDSETDIKYIIAQAKLNNLRAISITDHDIMEAHKEAMKYSGDELMIVPGIEITTDVGDIIALGIKEPIVSKDHKIVIKEIRKQNGIVYLPHPFRGRRSISIDLIKEIDVFEVFNGRSQGISVENDQFGDQEIVSFAKAYSLTGVGGSDAHKPGEYFRIITYVPSFKTQDELMNILRSKKIFPVSEEKQWVEATRL